MYIDIIAIFVYNKTIKKERRNTMMTMKQAFAKAQGHEEEYNAYDEYLDEMQKKHDCERARIYKQHEFKRENSLEKGEQK